jgi:hypothetical protein
VANLPLVSLTGGKFATGINDKSGKNDGNIIRLVAPLSELEGKKLSIC